MCCCVIGYLMNTSVDFSFQANSSTNANTTLISATFVPNPVPTTYNTTFFYSSTIITGLNQSNNELIISAINTAENYDPITNPIGMDFTRSTITITPVNNTTTNVPY